MALPDPSAPAVISEWKESSGRYEFVDLRAERRCFGRGPTIIVDHNPTIIGEQIAITIQVTAHVAVRIKDKETHLAAG